jgi:hypothetical protein
MTPGGTSVFDLLLENHRRSVAWRRFIGKVPTQGTVRGQGETPEIKFVVVVFKRKRGEMRRSSNQRGFLGCWASRDAGVRLKSGAEFPNRRKYRRARKDKEPVLSYGLSDGRQRVLLAIRNQHQGDNIAHLAVNCGTDFMEHSGERGAIRDGLQQVAFTVQHGLRGA